MRIDEQPNDSKDSRRRFLRSAGLATGTAALALTASQSNAASKGKSVPSLYPGLNARNFREIQGDENAHVEALVSALGTAARPKPNFQGLTSSSAQDFVQMSVAFENTGVGAYLGALPFILDRGYVLAAGSIALVEGLHSGYLNTLTNSPLVPGHFPFAGALTIAEVVNRISPYVVDLNGGPPLTFDTFPTAMNDIEILNFALALEYLEAEFYNINVPRIF